MGPPDQETRFLALTGSSQKDIPFDRHLFDKLPESPYL